MKEIEESRDGAGKNQCEGNHLEGLGFIGRRRGSLSAIPS
jgi:hypothetical protein